jgi:hypothetical protein
MVAQWWASSRPTAFGFGLAQWPRQRGRSNQCGAHVALARAVTGESRPRWGGSAAEELRRSGSDSGSGGLGQRRWGPATRGGKGEIEARIHCRGKYGGAVLTEKGKKMATLGQNPMRNWWLQRPNSDKRTRGGLGGSCGVLGEGKGRHEGKNSTKGALTAF